MRAQSMNRGTLAIAGAIVSLLVAAQPAFAQEAQAGPRWQAWLGCWETTANASAPVDAPAEEGMVCVVPTGDAAAVEIVTVEEGSITARSTLRADGEQHAAAREGCAGWESLTWSANGTRAYTRSQHTCDGGLERTSSGIMAFSASGDWIDVQAVTAGGNSGVHVLRYRPVTRTEDIPADLAAALGDRALASSAARMAATAPVATEDVIEASQSLDALAVEAWLVERDQPFTVDAHALAQLADAQVSTRVIDLLVALSYPEVFAIDDSARESYGRAGRPPVPYWDPWGYPGYGGYYPYGSRRGRWYGGYPSVIVIREPDGNSSSGGKAVKGRGYSQGNGDSTSQPTSRPKSGGDSARSGGGGGSGGGAAPRTAKPRDD